MADIKRMEKEGKIRGYKISPKKKALVIPKENKKSKYGNEKEVVDGIEFPSRREGRRYKKLIPLLRTGAITDLELQKEFELNEGGSHSYKYRADFVYRQDGKLVVEDAKGARTREYLKKRRLMKKVYGIEIKEV